MTTLPFSIEVFEDLAEFVEDLLGTDRLGVQLAKYERALAHGNSSYVPHRMVRNYRLVQHSIQSMKATQPSGSFIEMMELSLFRDLVRLFENDPAWSHIKSDLYSTGGFVHTVALLLFVHIQRAESKNIDLVTPALDGSKIGDAVMFTPLRDRIDVEVKCPELLWAPGELTDSQADKVVENAWKRSRRQIRERPSILVIGGLFVPKLSMSALVRAAERILERRENQHVGFIYFMSMTIIVDKPNFTPDGSNIVIGPKTKMNHQLVQHPVRNPYYKGIVEWRDRKDPTPGFEPSEPTVEFTLNQGTKPSS